MSLITLDFESFYRSKANLNTPGPKYSLASLTYEQYIFNPEFKLHGAAIKVDGNPTYWVPREQLEAELRKLFHPGNPHTLLCHNTHFDGAILSWVFGLQAARYLCTQSMSQALWNQASASLGALAKRVFPDDPTKRKGTELESVDGLYDLTPEQDEVLGKYAINDVDLTFECFREMWKYFPDTEFEVMDMVLRMFIEPIIVADMPRLQAHAEALKQDKSDLLKTLEEKEGLPSGRGAKLVGSGDQLVAYLKSKYGIVVPKKHSPTPKNPNNYTWALAKDDLPFMELRNKRPELEHIWAARVRVKSTLEESRVKRMIEHSALNRDLLAAFFKYSAAHTHRFGGGDKVNFQNFKRGSELRKCLRAPEGHTFVIADLSNIEARVLAWIAKEPKLLEAYHQDRDIYSEFAAIIFGRPVDRKRKVVNPETGETTKPDELEGNVGKVAVLGLGYGMGAPKFQMTLAKGPMGMKPTWFELDFCYHIVSTYRTTYPAITRFWRKCEQVIFDMARNDLEPYQWGPIGVEKNRLRLPNGLYLNYPGLRMENEAGGNFEYWNGKYWKSLYGGLLTENIVQALARIIMTDMMRAIDHFIRPLGGRIVLTVHDEVVVNIPEKYAEQVKQQVEHLMSIPSDWCNDGTLTLKAEADIDDCYSK